MNKPEFISSLRNALFGLPEEDIERSVDFYREMIDDRLEDGLTEEEAIAGFGSMEEISSQILSDIPLAKLVKAKVKPNRSLKGWEIVLLILGFPVWLPLLLSAGILLLSVYVVLWSVILTLYAVDISLALGGIAGIAGAFLGICLSTWNAWAPLLFLGGGLVCAGSAIFLFLGCNQAAKGILLLSKQIGLGVKSLFIRKGNVQ